jgi:hypothetical protein
VGIPGANTSDQGVSPLSRRSFWRKLAAAFVRLWALWLVGLALLVMPPFFGHKPPGQSLEGPQREQGPPLPALRAQELEQALRAGDDSAVLDFTRQRTLSTAERARLRALIEQLGNPSFAVRSKAAEELTTWGVRAAGSVRSACRHHDPEIAERAQQLLPRLVAGTDTSLLTSVVRYLVRKRPAQLAGVLLDLIPDVGDEALLGELQKALAEIAIRDGQPEPALVRGLADPLPEKRVAAAVALCRADADPQRAAVRKLLRDPDAEVRHRVALALLPSGEKDAIPALIDLLAELPLVEGWTILDLLYQVAGEQAPALPLRRDARTRDRCRAAWRRWWKEHGGQCDTKALAADRRANAAPLPVLLVMSHPHGVFGEVSELTPDGKSRWSILNLAGPLSAQVLPNERVLVVEYRDRRVSERDQLGGTHWNVQLDDPVVYAERLPSGNTFIACRNGLSELNRSGQSVRQVPWPVREIVTARPLPGNRALILTDRGACLVIDSRGKELSRFETGCNQVLAPGIDVTANGRVLLPDYAGNRVLEYSPSGELLWQADVVSPTSVQRLPNGNTLVASTRTHEVVEMDRLGRIVWRHTASTPPITATRRVMNGER